uniref:protein disulfide-isomerase n=1 Tax=Panthera tigris altaica TaxID=74533 RepID=A0A8C9KM42_PANTA
GMVDTAKKNFGGGNTAWEEKALSKYEFSEVRLLEIMESLCGSSDFDCHSMLEEHEERLEAWWLRLKKEYPDLFEWFCVKTLEVCCSPGTYGPDCLECDSTCVGCTGKGPEQCKECVPGYTKESGQCADVDECSLAEKVCTRESENCYNTPGSYVCVCPEGFEETETACVRTQTAADEVPEDPTQPPAREDL